MQRDASRELNYVNNNWHGSCIRILEAFGLGDALRLGYTPSETKKIPTFLRTCDSAYRDGGNARFLGVALCGKFLPHKEFCGLGDYLLSAVSLAGLFGIDFASYS